MKLKNILLVGGALALAYKAGKIAGGAECLKGIISKYGTIDFGDEANIVCTLGKGIIITTSKKGV